MFNKTKYLLEFKMTKNKVDSNFEYNEEIDSLRVYKDKGKKEIMGTVVIGNFIWDVNKDGKIAGLEIDNASDVLNIPSDYLKEIKSAKIDVVNHNGLLMLRYFLSFAKQTYNGSVAITEEKIEYYLRESTIVAPFLCFGKYGQF